MSAEFFLRIIFMIILGIAGGFWGFDLARLNPPETVRYTIGIALVGALTGLILTPYFSTRPARAIRRILGRIAAEPLFAGLAGLSVGVLTDGLLAFPISLVPAPLGILLPFVGMILFA